ncbi:MAG: hypothetical protein ACOZCO_08630 [Bacteroidota bacterium]
MLLPARHITLTCLMALSPLFTEVIAQDSISTTKKNSFFKSSGTIGLGYDYGFIPFAQSVTPPAGYFKTDGNFSLIIKDIPFNATFFYTNLKNINGLNNYFRVSFDAQAYRQIISERINTGKEKYLKQVPDLQNRYQLLQQKIIGVTHFEKNPEYFFNLPDSLKFPQIPDSLKEVPSVKPDIDIPEIDSAQYLQKFQLFKDSLKNQKEIYLSQSDSISNLIEKYKSLANETVLPFDQQDVDSLKYNTKLERWFGNVRKLDIGMCYPSHSTFLVNNIPVKGLNFEYETSNYYYAITAGTTINNLLFTNNIIQNNLQNTQNLFNFFDFNNPQQGRKIIAAKAGFGKKEGDHFYVGVLYGMGMQSYYYDSTQTVSSNNLKEHNVVMELDGKIKPKKWLELSAVYGKSSIRPLSDESDTANSSLTQLFSSFRSNAMLGKAIFSINKIKTNVSVTVRWIDPFFRSYGVGFMRSDNLRYEIKTDHRFGKKIKAGLYYRKDENNILNFFNYTTILHSGGASVQYRINKQYSLRGNFNPVFQYSFDAANENTYTNQNYIANVSVSYNKRIKRLSMVTNLIGSYYKLFNGASNTNYTNLCLTNAVNYKKFSHSLSASLFMTNGIDSVGGNTFLLYDDVSFAFKNITLTGGVKYSQHLVYGDQFGYNMRVNGRINKNLSLELRGEKLVLGDFYNSIGIDLYRIYPYIWSGRVIINW